MEELIDYVTNTPENTNPNVVRSMVSGINALSSGGSSDPAVLYVTGTSTILNNMLNITLDVTYNDIDTAIKAGKFVIYKNEQSYDENGILCQLWSLTGYGFGSNVYWASFGDLEFISTSVDEPLHSDKEGETVEEESGK